MWLLISGVWRGLSFFLSFFLSCFEFRAVVTSVQLRLECGFVYRLYFFFIICAIRYYVDATLHTQCSFSAFSRWGVGDFRIFSDTEFIGIILYDFRENLYLNIFCYIITRDYDI